MWQRFCLLFRCWSLGLSIKIRNDVEPETGQAENEMLIPAFECFVRYWKRISPDIYNSSSWIQLKTLCCFSLLCYPSDFICAFVVTLLLKDLASFLILFFGTSQTQKNLKISTRISEMQLSKNITSVAEHMNANNLNDNDKW